MTASHLAQMYEKTTNQMENILCAVGKNSFIFDTDRYF